MHRALLREPDAITALGDRFACVGRMVGKANQRSGARLTQEQQSDLVQDVILLLWQKLETFAGRSTLEGWAWTYVHFQYKNRVRRIARQRQRAEFDLDSLPTDPMANSLAHDYDRGMLDRCLAAIPDGMAEVLRLKHFEGLLFREIGERLELSENTAKTRYYRGLTKARAALRQLAGEEVLGG